MFKNDADASPRIGMVQTALQHHFPADTRYQTGIWAGSEYVEFSRPPVLFVSETSRGYYPSASYSLRGREQAEHKRTAKGIAATLRELAEKGIECRVEYELHGFADAARNAANVGKYDGSLGEVDYMVRYGDVIKRLHLFGEETISNADLAALRAISVVAMMTHLGQPIAKSAVILKASEVAVRSASYRKAEMTVRVYVTPGE